MGKLRKPDNIVGIDTRLGTEFFRWWCVFLRPLVSLTERETDVVSCFLKHRYELSRSISDPAVLDSVVMGADTRRKVIEECGMTQEHFYVVMSNLRKRGVIKDGVLNPRLIPDVKADGGDGSFQLLILFRLG